MAVEDMAKAITPGASSSTDPAAIEAYALEQYEKILRFQDAILSGKHATIKVPSSAVADVGLPALAASTAVSQLAKDDKLVAGGGDSSAAKAQHGVVPGQTSEFNPVLLEKSDELIRAEIQLQRQRLERALREEVDQRRASKHAQPDHLADLDPSAVLAEALTIVQETAPPPPSNEEPKATNGAESDSFDNNTFYSSQHDTNESRLTSIVRNRSAEADAQDVPTQDATSSYNADTTNTNAGREEQNGSYSPQYTPAAPHSVVPGLNNYVAPTTFTQAGHAPVPAGADLEAARAVAQQYLQQSGQMALNPGSEMLNQPPSPLRPAPTWPPAQAPLAAAHISAAQAGQYYSSSSQAAVGTPAQVAALRSGPASVTSPDSSSQGGRGSDKKKGKQKKKKRKSDRQGADTDTPYIKPEPRSPSPISGPSYIRPNKRQRQTNAQPQQAAYEDVAYDPAMPSGPQEPYQQAYPRDRLPAMYEAAERPQYTYVRHGGEYGPRETHQSRPASSHRDPYQEMQRPYGDRPYGEPPASVRYSVRPEGDSYREPAGPQPVRILVDGYGREYIEPPRQYVRHSVAPSPMAPGPDSRYERQPVRVLSSYDVAPPHDERAAVYSRPPSPYGGQQRVPTQPEYVSYDYRDNVYRQYTSRPATGHFEYVQVRMPPEQRVYLDGPGQHAGRAVSTRPMEPAPAAPEYRRVQSVRPEGAGLPYGAEPTASQGYKPYGGWTGQAPAAEGESSLAGQRIGHEHESDNGN
ncbi:hypothetical protein K4F52_003457 [Lecanicillium sp. MT-2017a]|nr:hypothetical protein K4F52_003457 [Lecanicillium sp. MT-2017a]